MARDDSYLLKISLALTVVGAAMAVRAQMPSESFKLLFVGTGAALLLPRALQNLRSLPKLVWVALVIWLVGFALSACVALAPWQALMGSYERAQGALCMALCLILAIARVPKDTLTPTVAWTSAVVSLWACAQALGLEPGLSAGQIQWQHADGFGARVFAGFGNPVNLGNWLCLAITYMLTQLRRSNHGWRLGLACVLAAVALCLSGTRAALVATLIAGICVHWSALNRAVRVGAVIVLVGVTLALMAQPTRTASIDARLALWQSTMAIPAPLVNSLGQPDRTPGIRLWLGYGQDLQSVPLAKATNTPGQFADRAHNAILDLWLSTGVLGVGSVLLLAVVVWRTTANDSGLRPIMLAAMVAWSVSFGLSADKALFALMLGALYSNAPAAKHTESHWPIVALSLLTLLLCWLSYRPLPHDAPAADYAFWRKPEAAIAHFRAGQALYLTQPNAAAQAFLQAQRASPWRQDFAQARQQVEKLQESK